MHNRSNKIQWAHKHRWTEILIETVHKGIYGTSIAKKVMCLYKKRLFKSFTQSIE